MGFRLHMGCRVSGAGFRVRVKGVQAVPISAYICLREMPHGTPAFLDAWSGCVGCRGLG